MNNALILFRKSTFRLHKRFSGEFLIILGIKMFLYLSSVVCSKNETDPMSGF